MIDPMWIPKVLVGGKKCTNSALVLVTLIRPLAIYSI